MKPPPRNPNPASIELVPRPSITTHVTRNLRVTPIPAHSDRDQLLERVYPRNESGRVLLNRRELMRVGAGTGLAALFGGVLVSKFTTGCDQICGVEKVEINVGALLVDLVSLIAPLLGISLPLPTRNIFINDSGVTQSLIVPQDLINETLCRWVKQVKYGNAEEGIFVDVPPGKSEFETSGEGLAADEAGDYHINTSAASSQRSTDTFTITPV